MNKPRPLKTCMPADLHWFSQQILDYYLTGKISTYEFVRYFHLPNSDYIAIGECVVAELDPEYDPYNFHPGVLDGYGSR